MAIVVHTHVVFKGGREENTRVSMSEGASRYREQNAELYWLVDV